MAQSSISILATDENRHSGHESSGLVYSGVATLRVESSMAKPKLGSGARFKTVEKSAAASGASDPAAVAAAAGRAKYGNAKMQKMAKAGKAKGK